MEKRNQPKPASLTYLSLCGMLGYGFPEESLERGLQAGPAFIGVDAGSTDPGPFYLGSGKSFVHPEQVKRDLTLALKAARHLNIPLIIGSAGGAGAAPHVSEFLEVLLEIARSNDLHFKLATIAADIDAETLVTAMRAGELRPCGPVPEASEQAICDCTHRVAQMGTDPIIAALRAGADVIVAGRCCDTAIFAALPILRGYDPGLALHSAKIAECGTLCAVPGGANDALLVTLERDSFTVCPVNPEKRCLPETVAAHSLYEQPSPHQFVEPEGTVDMRHSVFEPLDERRVRVRGTRLLPPAEQTVKVEGARRVGCRSLTLAGTCDPKVIENLDVIEIAVRTKVGEMTAGIPDADKVELLFRRYGLDAVMGTPPVPGHIPGEVGLVIEAIAPTRELADAAVSLARSTALHQGFAGRKTTAGNFAFPFSPSDLHGGDVYEFALYHLLTVADPAALFPITISEVSL